MPTLLAHPAPRRPRPRTALAAALAGLLCAALPAAVPAVGAAPSGSRTSADGPTVTFYAEGWGQGAALLTLPAGSAGVTVPPAGVRSARLRNLAAGTTFELYASEALAKRIDPLALGTRPGGAAWARVTVLRDVADHLVGGFETTYADADVRVEYNGPGPLDGRVTRVAVRAPTADPFGFRFVHASDLHVDVTPEAPDTCLNCEGNTRLVVALNGLDSLADPAGARLGPISFALLAGDVLDRPAHLQRERFAGIWGALRFPYHAVSGNHDLPISHYYVDYLAPLTQEQHGGEYLYSFNQNGVHFVAQHTNCPNQCVLGQNWDAFAHSLDFLEEDLRHVAAGVPLVVFQHYGFDAYTVAAKDWPEKYRARFLSIVRGRNLVGLLTGHSHGLEAVPVPGFGGDRDFVAGSLDARPGRGLDPRVWVFRVTRDSVLADALRWDSLAWVPGRTVHRALAAPDTLWSPPSAAPTGSDDVPAFAEVGGTRWMAWSAAADRRIHLARWDAGAGRWVSAGTVAPTSPRSVSWGAVAAVPFRGRLTVVWHEHGSSKMYVSEMDDAGSWSTPVQLPGMDVGNYKSPAAAVVNGTLHVVFNGWGSTRLWHTSTTDGTHFAAASAIPGSDTDNQPAVVDQGGMLGLVWTRHLVDRAIRHQQLQDGTWSAPFAVVSGTATSDRGPGVAWRQGRLFLAWSDAGRLYGAEWKDNVWSAKALLPVPSAASHRGASMGVAGSTLYVGWNADGRAYYAQRGL